MQIGLYSIDFTCDNEDCDTPALSTGRFTGSTGGKARDAARSAGWRVGRQGAADLCPGCHEHKKDPYVPFAFRYPPHLIEFEYAE